MSVRKFTVPILLFISATYANPFSGMTTNLGRALGRLSNTGPEPYTLLPGLSLSPITSWNITYPTNDGRAKGRTLVESITDVLRTHRLTWTVAPGLQMCLYADEEGMYRIEAGTDNTVQATSRTFGMMRRMKLAILPIMFKLGVITTLLILLTAFALKGLTIGVILIVLTSVGFLSKLHVGHHDGGLQKEVHVHVHGGGGGWQHHHHDPWDRESFGSGGYVQHNVPPSHHSTASPWAQYI